MSAAPEVSVVICTHNRAGFLRACVESVERQAAPAGVCEILIVENACTDDTARVAAELARREGVRHVAEPAVGLSHARNRGWREARGHIVAYLDDDATAEPGWLARALEAFREVRPEPAWVGGPIDLAWEAPPPDWIGPESWHLFGHLDWGAAPGVVGPGRYLGGGNSFFRRDCLAAQGGFDPRLGRRGRLLVAGEETHLEWRLRRAGETLYYHPGVRVRHHVGRERMERRWMLRHAFWDGVTGSVMQALLRRAVDVSIDIHAASPTPAAGGRAGRVLRQAGRALGLGGTARATLAGRMYLAYAAGAVVGWAHARLGGTGGSAETPALPTPGVPRRSRAQAGGRGPPSAAEHERAGVSALAFSIVIPAGRPRPRAELVAALLGQSAGLERGEVVWVSPEPLGDVPEHPAFRRVVTGVLLPPGAMRNRGAAAARGQVLLFLDDDCVPPADWVERMRAALDATGGNASGAPAGPPAVGAVGCACRSPEPGFVAQCADHALFADCVSAVPAFRPVGSGALAVHRAAFEAAGGFDPELRASEDWDFGLRLAARGWRVRYEPSIAVAHRHGRTSLGGILRDAYGSGRASGLTVQRRHVADLSWLARLSVRLGNPWLYPLLVVPYAALVAGAHVARELRRGPGVLRFAPVCLAARLAYHAGVWRRLCAGG